MRPTYGLRFNGLKECWWLDGLLRFYPVEIVFRARALDADTQDYLRKHAGIAFGDESPEIESENAQKIRREPIWDWLLILVVAFMIAESCWALLVSKSRSIQTPGASMA